MALGVVCAFLMMDCSDGSLPVIWPITSALAMRTQSSYFWWRHHWAAAAGSPYMVPDAASAGVADPKAMNPAAAAKATVLAVVANLVVFTGASSPCAARCGWRVKERFRSWPVRYLHKFLE